LRDAIRRQLEIKISDTHTGRKRENRPNVDLNINALLTVFIEVFKHNPLWV